MYIHSHSLNYRVTECKFARACGIRWHFILVVQNYIGADVEKTKWSEVYVQYVQYWLLRNMYLVFHQLR